MSEVKVLIVEDEPLIAGNIATYLSNNDYTVSGVAHDEQDARQQLRFNTPDIVIMDINLGGGDEGIRIAEMIKTSYQVPVLFLTAYADKDTVSRAKNAEPGGYIVKPFEERSLIAALEVALFNHARKISIRVPTLSFAKINKHLVSQVSEREFEVLQLIYGGMANQQIAHQMNVSVNTVKKHINNIYLKIDVGSRSTAISRLLELMMK